MKRKKIHCLTDMCAFVLCGRPRCNIVTVDSYIFEALHHDRKCRLCEKARKTIKKEKKPWLI